MPCSYGRSVAEPVINLNVLFLWLRPQKKSKITLRVKNFDLSVDVSVRVGHFCAGAPNSQKIPLDPEFRKLQTIQHGYLFQGTDFEASVTVVDTLNN